MNEPKKFTPEDAFSYEGPDKIVHFTDYLLLKAGKSDLTKKFKCGFSLFDKNIDGLETGEVVVVSGHTKAGKTLFTESWVKSMAKCSVEAKTMILSFEVRPDKMLAKYVSDSNAPIYLPLSLEAMNFDWLYRRCLEAKYKYNCRIVLIDHLHFMVDMATRQNMSLNIGGFMRRLKKDIALDLNLAVILIAHQGQPKENQSASLGNIRDSSFVGQESDATIIVSRTENLDEADLKEIAAKQGEWKAAILRPPINESADLYSPDKYSACLATVEIAVHRRTGVFGWKKLFRKNGHFMEEV